MENGNYICTKCVSNSELKDNICVCNSNSFNKDNNWCYKCNDFKNGNPACDETSGCEYSFSSDKIKCKKYGDGYYESSEGQCNSCLTEIYNCGKCHYDNDCDNKKVVCDKCICDIYSLNTKENICELNDCKEYPEISSGCIICKDKLNYYKNQKKCQRCKYGYFKTNDEKCIYCSSEKYGGPGCYECGYETNSNGVETENIICKECYSDLDPNQEYCYDDYYPIFDDTSKSPLLSKEGKCYNCQIQFTDACERCELIKEDNGVDSLKCVSCIEGYYLTPEGNCVYLSNFSTKISNCETIKFSSGEITFEYIVWSDEYGYFNFNSGNLNDVNGLYKTIYDNGLNGFEKKCLSCKTGFYLNNEGNCEKLNYEKCSFNNILNNFEKLCEACYDFCNYNDIDNEFENVIIKIKSNNGEFGLNDLNYISRYSSSYINKLNTFINDFEGSNYIKTCLNNSGEGGENAPENLKHCKNAYYYPDNKTYTCYSCEIYYYLNRNTHLCDKTYVDPCSFENVGTELMPDYRCVIDKNYNSITFALIMNENNDIQYLENDGELKHCVEAKENTSFIESKYNCTKCLSIAIPYYSRYYERIICKNIQDQTNEKELISYEIYNQTQDKAKAINGICEKDYLFTPDGKDCYRCDDEKVGMVGCKGSCTFSNEKNIHLKCDGKCKIGYIESSEGVCTLCSLINKGCYECHYENEYPKEYQGIKRKRRFACDYCMEGYMISFSGKCVSCDSLGLDNCNKCKVDSNNDYICTKCQDRFFVNDEGKCQTCSETNFKGINQNKCIHCSNSLEGGIDKCLTCESNGEKVICKQCFPGYILSTTENSCLEVMKYKELEKFNNCLQLTKENDKYKCSKCIEPYTIITNNNIKECIYIRTLYDPLFTENYKNHYFYLYPGSEKCKEYSHYSEKDYIY